MGRRVEGSQVSDDGAPTKLHRRGWVIAAVSCVIACATYYMLARGARRLPPGEGRSTIVAPRKEMGNGPVAPGTPGVPSPAELGGSPATEADTAADTASGTAPGWEDVLPVDDMIDAEAARTLLALKMLSLLPAATDGADLVVLSGLRGSLKEPSVSPDGKWMTFTLGRPDETSDVYLYDLEDGSYRNLTEGLPARGPRVSGGRLRPDGRSLLVSGFPHSGIWEVDIDTGRPRLLADEPAALAPRWSPDGKQITYTVADLGRGPRDPRSRIDVLDLDTGNIVRSMAGEQGEILCEPCFSPDGKQVAYVTISRQAGEGRRSLVLHPLEDNDGPPTVLTFAGHDVHAPVFSPDGRHIAYRGGTHAWGELFVYSLADGTERQVTQGSGSNPSWLPDSDGIVFSSARGTGRSRVYQISLGTNPQDELTR